MSKTTDTIDTLIEALRPLYLLLLQHPLSTGERKARSANLFAEAPDLVRAAAEALEEDRPAALFPDVDADPAALLDLQDEADALFALRAHLLALCRLTMDTYLCRQEEALRLALDVLRRVRQDELLLDPADRRRLARAFAMAKAEMFLPDRSQAAAKGTRARSRGGAK